MIGCVVSVRFRVIVGLAAACAIMEGTLYNGAVFTASNQTWCSSWACGVRNLSRELRPIQSLRNHEVAEMHLVMAILTQQGVHKAE
jgi:hypothetical protein